MQSSRILKNIVFSNVSQSFTQNIDDWVPDSKDYRTIGIDSRILDSQGQAVNYCPPDKRANNSHYYDVITISGDNGRSFQFALEPFNHKGEIFYRTQHDSATTDWFKFAPYSSFSDIATLNNVSVTDIYEPGLYRCNACNVLGVNDDNMFWGYAIIFKSEDDAERYWVVFHNQSLKIHFICNYYTNGEYKFINKSVDLTDIAYNSVINPQIAGKAAKLHVSTSPEYGAATSGYYGHVKIADTYTSSLGHDTALSSAGAYAMYNEYHNYIDDDRWFRRVSTAKDQPYITIRSTAAPAGNWPLMIGVGEMVIMFNCMTSGLTSSLSTTRNCWKALVQPDTQIISRVQAMIEGGNRILVRVFLSSEWNNGYSAFVRSMDRQYEILSVGVD